MALKGSNDLIEYGQKEELNLLKTKEDISLKVKDSKEIELLMQQIDLKDANTIIKFGGQTANGISKLSDEILRSIQTTKVEDSGKLLNQLNKIMDKFDIKDFEDKKAGIFDKFLNKAKTSIDSLFNKYNSMSSEVEVVHIMLKEYEAEIITTNSDLEKMFGKNLEYFEELEKYIIAGKKATDELKFEIMPKAEEASRISDNKLDTVNLNQLSTMLEMIEQRVFDLELAQNIALQSLPSIKSIQRGNYDLIRKINSAFIITLPIFKQCLTQSIILKRQLIQAKATSALDEKTRELLLRNAENTAMQTKLTAQLASGNFIDTQTLEKTWETIVNGIEETKKIQEAAKQTRIDGSKKLMELKEDFSKRVGY